MAEGRLDTYQKALAINRNRDWYGTVAEIGAGQETSQWLFHVGGASGTVAKSMSAYDMAFSDAIYGKAPRYVSRARLKQMLDHEYELLLDRLSDQQDHRRFFCFANTVVATSHSHHGPGQGWLGVRFQREAGDSEASEITIHVKLFDVENFQQQETLGRVGINLLYGAYKLYDRPKELIDSLMDQLNSRRVEVDMIDFCGPVGKEVDNRLLSIELVSRGLTDAAMFTAAGENVELADRFHGKGILLQRGTFRPVVLPVVRMMELANEKFKKEIDEEVETVLVSEMNLKELKLEDEQERDDLLARLEVLQDMGRDVLITDFREHYRLSELLDEYTDKPIVMVMGLPTMEMLFDKSYYEDLHGGVFEAMGRLFRNKLKLYIYPYREKESGDLMDLARAEVGEMDEKLLDYLRASDRVQAIEPDEEQEMSVFPQQVVEMIRNDDPKWKEMVPDEVVSAIEQGKLLRETSDESTD